MKREQDEAYRISLEADRAKVCVWGGKDPMGWEPFGVWECSVVQRTACLQLCSEHEILKSSVL